MKYPMDVYDPDDFLRYFGGAVFVHPETATPCYAHSYDSDTESIITRDMNNRRLPSIPYQAFSFDRYSECPPLGYRHTEDGKYLFYISRRAFRQAAKGLRQSTVIINRVGEVHRLHELAGTSLRFIERTIWGASIVQAMFFPEYPTLEEAVNKLRHEEAFGFALTNSFAITLLTQYADYPFVLLYKGQRAAFSKDGVKWKLTHPEFQTLISRHLKNISLEESV